jgi:pyruvate,orthophosphate dikinase
MKPLLGGKGATSPRCAASACRCRPGSRSPPRSAPTTTPTSGPIRRRCAGDGAGVASLEQQTGKKFGDLKNPLLVSVRSGARDSMPGMMDTILNLGLNDQTVEALATKTGNPRFAWDCYRRFVQMYGDVVLGVQKRPDEDHDPFETVIHGSSTSAITRTSRTPS